MKKLIVTSATVLYLGLTAFATDGSDCTKKCDKKCDQKECMKSDNSNKKCCMIENKSEMKCNKNKESCKNTGGKCEEKKDMKPGDKK